MKTFLKILRLDFLPSSRDAGLLVLRLWLGLSVLVLHGWSKLTDFSEMADKFPDPIGIGSRMSLALATFAEVFCAALIILGLFTRLAAVILAINMATAFFLVHEAALSGPNSGELAFLYLAGWITLVLSGAGSFSVDAKMGSTNARNT